MLKINRYSILACPVVIGVIFLDISFSKSLASNPIDIDPGVSNELIVRFSEEHDGDLNSIVASIRARKWSEVPISSIASVKPRDVEYFAPKFSRHNSRHSNTARARLSRFLVIKVPQDSDMQEAIGLLTEDPKVRSVSRVEYGISSTLGTSCEPPDLQNPQSIVQYSASINWPRDMLQVDSAYSYQYGYSTVAAVDFGIYEEHGALKAFNGSSYIGGNFIPHISFQTGARISEDPNKPAHPYLGQIYFNDADEKWYRRHPGDASYPGIDPWSCTTHTDEYIRARWAGHGTHVAGIVAGRHLGLGTSKGICKNCPLMIAHVAAPVQCVTGSPADPWIPTIDADITLHHSGVTLFSGIAFAVDLGAQVITTSLGLSPTDCSDPNNEAYCTVLEYASDRDVMIFVSAGNQANSTMVFPANDPRTYGISGVNESGARWFESAGCGSNYGPNSTVGPSFSAPAVQVYSTMYPDKTWNPISCHVYNDQTASDQPDYGYCTGTSMSAPLVAGVAGILRSADPLATKDEIFEVMKDTADNGPITGFWGSYYGWGRPQAADAIKEIYGQSGGVQNDNSITPLFRLYSSIADDNAYTTKPQVAVTFHHNQTWDYESYSGSNLVSGYSEFPDSPEIAAVTPPRADVFVLTGHKSPHSGHDTVPLYRMRWTGSHGGNPVNADRVLVKSIAEIEGFAANGYDFEGIEGYVIEPCSPEPGCIPSGMVRLYRAFNSSLNDHAVFPESQLSTMQSQGYSQNIIMLGYAYPN